MRYVLLLKKIRKSRGMTQDELGKKIGVTSRVVGSWERVETPMQIEDVCKCAEVLGCTPNDLVGWADASSLSDTEKDLLSSFHRCDELARASILIVCRDSASISICGDESIPGDEERYRAFEEGRDEGPCLNVRRLRRELFERDKTIAKLKARLAEKESADVQ